MSAILLCAAAALIADAADAPNKPGEEGTPRMSEPSEPSEEPKRRFYSGLPDAYSDATYDTILVRTPISDPRQLLAQQQLRKTNMQILGAPKRRARFTRCAPFFPFPARF